MGYVVCAAVDHDRIKLAENQVKDLDRINAGLNNELFHLARRDIDVDQGISSKSNQG